MNKRGYMGPFRCSLCNQNHESTDHLFLNCNFTKQVMHSVYSELTPQISWSTSSRSLIGKWSKYYKGSLTKNPILSRVWKASIKYVCWKIWLARNKRIFKEKLVPPPPVASLAIDQLGEYLSSRNLKARAGGPLIAEEEKWLEKINLPIIHPLTLPKKSCWQLQFPPPPRFQKLAKCPRQSCSLFRWCIKRKPRGGRCGRGIVQP
jgi:hypothetical protein